MTLVSQGPKGGKLTHQTVTDPKYPQHGLSNDHMMPKRNQIVKIQKHKVSKG